MVAARGRAGAVRARPLPRVARRRSAASRSPTTASSGAGRSPTSRASGRRSGTTSRSAPTRPTSACSARDEMPGAEWFPGALLNYAEHMLGRDEDADAVAVVARLADARAVRPDVRRAPRAGRAGARRAAAARRRPRRPCGRLPPEHPRDPGRVPRDREPRGDLGDVPARVRRRAASSHRLGQLRAEGSARGRRLPLRRQARRPPRAGRRGTRGPAEPRGGRARPVRGRRRRRAAATPSPGTS